MLNFSILYHFYFFKSSMLDNIAPSNNLKLKKMEKYQSVEKWLASNPSKEVIEKVLNVINRGIMAEIRKEYWLKNSELVKMKKAIKSMESVGLTVSKEANDKVKVLTKELETIQKQLPTPKPKKEKIEINEDFDQPPTE